MRSEKDNRWHLISPVSGMGYLANPVLHKLSIVLLFVLFSRKQLKVNKIKPIFK